ncbi:MAG: hypothetical protein Q9201_002064 [Fulgogasparrea decipioides]
MAFPKFGPSSRLAFTAKARLCKDCLAAQRRSFSTPPSHSALPEPPPKSGFAHLTNRALISIHGRDAAHFLQGLTTSNIQTSSPQRSGFYSAFLNAQGRVLHDVFIYPTYKDNEEARFLIDVDANNAAALEAHLKRFKLRAKFKMRVLGPEERYIWGTWGNGQQTNALDSDKRQESWEELQMFGCIDPRAPDMGRRILTSDGSQPSKVTGEEVSVQTYDIRRMLKGVPQGHDEIISGEALPQESNIDYMSGIDFRKGCYVGQELTIRTHHTGVVRKRILPVQVYGKEGKPPKELRYDPDTSLELPSAAQNIARVDTRGRSAGKWLKGIGNIGLALCRLETMTDVKLTEEGSHWSPEHEFKMSWQRDDGGEDELKIKAFVPEWHRNRVSVRDMHGQQSASNA